MPKRFVRHFIRGYFDGDGSVSLRNIKSPRRLTVAIYTASINMYTNTDIYLKRKYKKFVEGIKYAN